MSNHQQDKINQKESAPLFVQGLFSGNSAGSLFNPQTTPNSLGTAATSSSKTGLFGAMSNNPSPFAAANKSTQGTTTTSPLFGGLFAPQSTSEPSKTSIVSPFASQPSMFDTNKVGGLFGTKTQSKSTGQVTKISQPNNLPPNLGIVQGGLFGGITSQPKIQGLFGSQTGQTSGGLFGGQPLPSVAQKQQKKEKVPEIDTQKMFQGSLFGKSTVPQKKSEQNGMLSQGLFGSLPPKKQQKKDQQKPKQNVPQPLFSNSLFGGNTVINTGSLFGQPKINQPKPNQQNSQTPTKQKNEKITKSALINTPFFGDKHKLIEPSVQKQKQTNEGISAFGLLGNIKNQANEISQPILQKSNKNKIISLQQPKSKQASDNVISPINRIFAERAQQASKAKQTPSYFFGQKQQQTSVESKTVPSFNFQPLNAQAQTNSKQSQSALNSLFPNTAKSQPIQADLQNKIQNQTPLIFSIKQQKNGDLPIPSSTEPTKPVFNFNSSNNSSISSANQTMKSKTEPGKNTQGTNSQNARRNEQRPYFQTMPHRDLIDGKLFDFKVLKQEQKQQTFSSFLSSKTKLIVQSIKLYFTTKTKQLQYRKYTNKEDQKNNFYIDLTNLITRILGHSQASFPMMQHFIKRVMIEQRYQSVLFTSQKLNQAYFDQYKIYTFDYLKSHILNQLGSEQLQRMVDKIICKWNVEKTNIINFVLNYSDLIRIPASDLFCYLFKHLLEMDGKSRMVGQNAHFIGLLRDYNKLIRSKLIELLQHYNKSMNKSYPLVPSDSLKKIIELIQYNNNSEVIQLSLKILLNSIGLQHQKQISSDVVAAVRTTKSLALLPFRAILHRLSYLSEDFNPIPADLFKYIKGNQWIQWIDIYLSHSKGDIQLQNDEPKQIVLSLQSIDGSLLLSSLLNKKGVTKFFNLLKQQNLQNLYYRLLQACIFDQQSINKIDEFYFKKASFYDEYYQIIDYVTNYNQNLGQPVMNQQSVIESLEPKMSLIAKIIQIDAQKIFELEKLIFKSNYNKLKKFKLNEPQVHTKDGRRLTHIFIDLINIYSSKSLNFQHLLSKLFKALTSLLKNKTTQPILINTLSINKPSFHFTNQYITTSTVSAINELLDHVITSNYIYDLILDGAGCQQQDIRNQMYYPFRYKLMELKLLMRNNQHSYQKCRDSFPVYWMNQLIKIIIRQKFNPYLLSKLLTKLYIIPSQQAKYIFDSANQQPAYRNKISAVPQIFSIIIQSVNSINIWEQINKVLEFRVNRNQGCITMVNKLIQTTNTAQANRLLFFTLKLTTVLFKLNDVLLTYQDSNCNHFIIKVLSSINVLTKMQLNNLMSSNSTKNNLMLAAIANIQSQQPFFNDTSRIITWQAQQIEDNVIDRIMGYIKQNRNNIDFEVVNNFVKSPTNRYIHNSDNVTTVSLELIINLLRISAQCNIQHLLTGVSMVGQNQKNKFRDDVVNKIEQAICCYLRDKEAPLAKYKILQFIYDLKYGAGNNKLNIGLAERLFAQFMKNSKSMEKDAKLSNLLMKYLLKQLQQRRDKYDNYIEHTIQNIINNLQFNPSPLSNQYPITDTKQIGKILSYYKQKDFALSSINQMQRLIEERAIVTIADQLQTLEFIIRAMVILIMRKKNGNGLISCIHLLNRFVANNNIVLIGNDMRYEGVFLNGESRIRMEQPRMFLRDPLQLYLMERGQLWNKKQIQNIQKNNIIQWFIFIINNLSTQLNNFTCFILTIDRHLYANNPIQYNLYRQDSKHNQLFCHLPLQKITFSAVQLFGKQMDEAISNVQRLGQNVVDRLINVSHVNGKDHQLFVKGLQILGYCIQWLRSRTNSNMAVETLLKKINNNYHHLLPSNILITSQAIRVFLSLSTISKKILSQQAKLTIHKIIHELLQKYYINLKELVHNDYSDKLSLLVQQSIPLLLSIPPQKNKIQMIELLVSVWSQEFNYQYFFNESRLILQLCHLYPDEMAKFRPLGRCLIIQNLSSIYNRYDKERRPEGMAWLWVVKIATALAGHHQSTIVAKQIQVFMKHYKDRIINVIGYNQQKVTKGYLQDLQAILQLMITFLSQKLWVNMNRQLVQEITYILSHKTVKLFVGLSQGKVKFTINSSNDKVLADIKPSGQYDSNTDEIDEFSNFTNESIFQFQMRIKMLYCLRNYCICMQKAFKISFYVQKHFDEPVFDSYRYFSSFWDATNKNIICIFNYITRQLKFWTTQKNLNQKIKLMNDCYKAPLTFVQNGYLTSIIDIPQSDAQILQDIYMLGYLSAELSVIHWLKERMYMSKYNNLMSSHIQSFGKRIKEQLKQLKAERKKIVGLVCNSELIKDSYFDALREVMERSNK